MSIDNICAGFKKSGVYPFNPEAILKNCPESTTSSDDSKEVPEDESASSAPEDESEDELATSIQNQFSPEQLTLFEERFQNKYDIYTDHHYLAWLQEFHPDSVPSIEAMLGLECDDNSTVDPLSALTVDPPSAPTGCSPSVVFSSTFQSSTLVLVFN